MIDLEAIREAADLLQGRVRRTELLQSNYFSARVGLPLYFKCENLQRTGSFKIRGAANFLLHHSAEALRTGVITASAGNHAQGVACAAAQRGVSAIAVMPENTPLAKVMAARHYGAEVLLHGSGYEEAVQKARELTIERGLMGVPAFDHSLVIAGQGTIALEVLADLPAAETLVVPIGGGGLIAGLAVAAKSLKPGLRLIGVEAAGAAAALLSRRRGARVQLAAADSLADGIAVKSLGELTFPIVEQLVDDLITVEEEDIAQAIVALLEKGKLVVEGAGALSLAAVLFGPRPLFRGPTVCILSGGNIDVQTLSRVVQRGMMAEGRFLKVQVDLADVPGALAALAALLAELRANIFHISHDRRNAGVPLGRAEVRLELETRGPEHIQEIRQRLEQAGYGVELRP